MSWEEESELTFDRKNTNFTATVTTVTQNEKNNLENKIKFPILVCL